MTIKNRVKPPIKMSATMAMNAKVNRLMAEGHQVFHLGFGESRFPVHPKILAAFREHAPARSYLPVVGLPELRAQIAAYYRRKFQLDVEAGQVLVGSGSKSLLFAAMQALEGDLLLPSPTWVSYDVQAYLTGKAVSWIPTRLEDNHCLTPDGLMAALAAARAAGQSPAILILTSPGNPTGVIYPPQLLAALAEVARAESLIVISDEIYAQTSYGETPFTSMAAHYPEGTLVTGGLSKHLSLGGWRFGVAILPPNDLGAELARYMAAVASNIWTTVTAPVQYAALAAYADDPEIDTYVESCTAIHGYVTGYLYRVFRSLDVPAPVPSGGFYIYPSFNPWRESLAKKHHIQTGLDLANFLLDEEHIAALPGSDFGADPDELTLRIATSYLYGLTDDEAETVLAAYQKNLSPDQFLAAACPRVIEVGERFKALVQNISG
jgi:aspartate/methionine/tyrosine aminotransferase